MNQLQQPGSMQGVPYPGFRCSRNLFFPGVPPSGEILAIQFPDPVQGLEGSIISRLQPPEDFISV